MFWEVTAGFIKFTIGSPLWLGLGQKIFCPRIAWKSFSWGYLWRRIHFSWFRSEIFEFSNFMTVFWTKLDKTLLSSLLFAPYLSSGARQRKKRTLECYHGYVLLACEPAEFDYLSVSTSNGVRSPKMRVFYVILANFLFFVKNSWPKLKVDGMVKDNFCQSLIVLIVGYQFMQSLGPETGANPR